MKKIETLAELKGEKIRLRQKRFRLENEIKNDFTTLKESLTPSKLITEGASKMLVNKNHGAVNEIVGLATNFLLKKVVFKNSGFLIRTIVPFIARNTANNLLQENKTKILGWIGDLILKAGKKSEPQTPFDKTTADTNY